MGNLHDPNYNIDSLCRSLSSSVLALNTPWNLIKSQVMEEKSLSTPLKQWPNRPKFPFVHGLKTNQKLAHQLACRGLKIAWALKSSTISTFLKANFGGIPSFETSQILQVALLRQWHGNFKMASAPECTVHRALCFFWLHLLHGDCHQSGH